ncbi:MAG: hypothetical protein EBT22_11245 [Chloroflexi bacterium]|nr:hypothetical protein [Chloroflexota bacterium]
MPHPGRHRHHHPPGHRCPGPTPGLQPVQWWLRGVPYLSAPLLASRYIVLQFVLAGLAIRIVWRILHAALVRQVRLVTRYVIAGSGPGATEIAKVIAHDLGPDHEVIGCVDDDAASTDDGPVIHLGDYAVLADLIASGTVNTLVLATAGAMPAPLQRQVIQAYERGMRVVPMPALYESVTGRVLVDHAREFWATTLPHLDQDWAYRLASRGADIVAAVIGLVGTLCLIPPVFVAMRLDEFPQFWNILRGDMALVGPRPERPELVDRLEEAVPFYRVRLAVRPGLTGWAQVKASYASSEADTLVKFQYDLYYLRHRSVYLDLLIVLKTVGVVLGFRGT